MAQYLNSGGYAVLVRSGRSGPWSFVAFMRQRIEAEGCARALAAKLREQGVKFQVRPVDCSARIKFDSKFKVEL